jgi:uncharacterized membrane protein
MFSISGKGNGRRPITYIGDVFESSPVPGKDREEDSGKYTTSYPDSDFIDAIQTLGGMAGTSEIAETVGCTRRTAYTRLQSLESEGQVTSRKVGNSLLWSISD